MSEHEAAQHPRENLSRYLDGELSEGEARTVAEHLESCTECAREAAIYRSVGSALREETRDESVWDEVSRRIARPLGWLMLVAGVAVLAVLAVVEWIRSGALTFTWLATTAAGVGLALLAVSIGWEQYREWRRSPYRNVER